MQCRKTEAPLYVSSLRIPEAWLAAIYTISSVPYGRSASETAAACKKRIAAGTAYRGSIYGAARKRKFFDFPAVRIIEHRSVLCH